MTCIADTASINLTVASGQLTADLVVDPGAGLAPNLVTVNPQGVYVIGADGWIPLPSTLAFSSADGHMFVATSSADLRSFIGPGDKIRLVQSGVPGYFFVHAITATQIWLYGGTLYTLAGTAISSPFFSKVHSPIGFTLNTASWTEELRDTTDPAQINPVNLTWYNLNSNSLAIPIGSWRVEFLANGLCSATAGTVADMSATLSTANNSQTDSDFTARIQTNNTGVTNPALRGVLTRWKPLVLAVKTSYFLNVMSPNGQASISFQGNGVGATFVRAINAYL